MMPGRKKRNVIQEKRMLKAKTEKSEKTRSMY